VNIAMRIALLTITLLALLAASAHASPRQVMSFEAPEELLDDARRAATLDEIRAFGVTQIRQVVFWQSYAPRPKSKRRPRFNASNPDAYPAGTWARLDSIVAEAQLRGIDVMLTPTGPGPKWATASKKDNLTRPSAMHFGQFVTALARRYGDAISMWSVWNEPNQPQFLLPQYRKGKPYSPRLYRGLYRAAYKAIRSVRANRRDRILIGETSPRGNENIVHPLRFLRGMACLNGAYKKSRGCSRLPADGYAHHAYTTRSGPRFVPDHAADVTIGVLDRLVRALDRAGRARGLPSRLRIYLTEFGIQSEPDRISGVSFERQPAYYAIAEHMAYVNPRVALFSQYLMRDDLPREEGYRFRGFESGLRRSNGQRKPAYRAFPNPLAVERYGGTDVLWGLIRPQEGVTRVTVEVRRKGQRRWRRLRTLNTTERGVFGLRATHRDDQRYRVRWTSEAGKRYTGPSIRSYRLST
jgi:Cellulase (glycosyl hydrolase family 5)